MKVICIDNVSKISGTKTDLVIGQIYEVIGENKTQMMFGTDMYQIERGGKKAFYSVDLFRKLDDWREDKLKELGI